MQADVFVKGSLCGHLLDLVQPQSGETAAFHLVAAEKSPPGPGAYKDLQGDHVKNLFLRTQCLVAPVPDRHRLLPVHGLQEPEEDLVLQGEAIISVFDQKNGVGGFLAVQDGASDKAKGHGQLAETHCVQKGGQDPGKRPGRLRFHGIQEPLFVFSGGEDPFLYVFIGLFADKLGFQKHAVVLKDPVGKLIRRE